MLELERVALQIVLDTAPESPPKEPEGEVKDESE